MQQPDGPASMPSLPGHVTVVRANGLVARVVGVLVLAALFVALIAVGAVVIPIALLVVGVIVGLALLFFVIGTVRAWMLGIRGPNGTLDGRRNVRVRRRGEAGGREVVDQPGTGSQPTDGPMN